MIITYQGGEFFKVQFGETTLACNPISKDSKLKGSRFGADIALVSLNHPDFNGTEVLEFGDKKPFIVAGSGEYEIKGVFIKGFPSKSHYGLKDGNSAGVSKDEKSKEKINTIYTLSLDGINLCFLGALSEDNIASETTEAMDDIDVLFVPIGGDGVLDPATAYKIAVKLEPKIIIPMHYSLDGSQGNLGDKNALKVFLKEAGEEKTTPVEKLTIKRKDLEGKQGDVVVLTQNN